MFDSSFKEMKKVCILRIDFLVFVRIIHFLIFWLRQSNIKGLRSKAGFALLATSQNEIDGGGHNGKM